MTHRFVSTLPNLRWPAAAVALLLCGAPAAHADEPPASQPAQPAPTDDSGARDHARGDRRPQAATDPELRKKFREMLARRLESRRREIEKLDQALKLIDEGKSFDDLRALFPDVPHPGQRGEGRDQWIRRWEEGGPGMQPEGPTPNGASPGRGPTEPARPLTNEERTSVREILSVTAPKTLDKLRELEKSKPEEAEKQYSETFRRSRYLLETRKKDQRMFELRLQELRHARRAGEEAQAIAEIDAPKSGPATAPASGGESDRAQHMSDLRKALRELYSVRTEIMQRDSQRMGTEAAERAAKQDEAVEKSVNEMIDRAKRKGSRGGPGGDHRAPGDDVRPGPKPQQ